MQTIPDISCNHLTLLAWALRRRNMDVDAIFSEAGAPILETNTPLDRVPLSVVGHILEVVQTRTGDPSVPLEIYRSMKLTHFDTFGIALSCSSTLMEFFERAQRFCSYVGPLFDINIERDSTTCTIQGIYNSELVDSSDKTHRHVELFMYCIAFATLGLIRELFDGPAPVEQGYLSGKPDKKIVEKFEQSLNAPVQTEAGFTGAKIKMAVLLEKLPGGNPNMARSSDLLLTEQLAEINNEDIIRRCEQLITLGVPQGEVSLAGIAKEIGLSERALRRQLLNRGVNFSELVSGIKKTLAIQYLREGKLRVNEIAYRLGFDNPSNFSRAFRKWTGNSPSHYKQYYLF